MSGFMGIISISVDDETLEKMDRMKSALGFRSRSRLVRAAVDALENQSDLNERLQGVCSAAITVTYDKHQHEAAKDVTESFGKIVKTEFHQHNEGVCTRVLMLRGDGTEIKKLFRSLRSWRATRSVSISVF